jgi:peroxiredoxin
VSIRAVRRRPWWLPWQTRQRFGLRYPLLGDPQRTVTEVWGVDVFPTSFIVDKEGRIVHRFRGMLDWDASESVGLIEELLPPAAAAPP